MKSFFIITVVLIIHIIFFFSSRRRHTRLQGDWSSDVCSSDLIPDGSADANPHGMAIKFHLPDGSETDMVINSLKFFPVATGEDFRDLLLALAASPPDAPKPTKFEQFA